MKKLLFVCVASAMAFPVSLMAEGKPNHDWAEEAALKYEKKAEIAAKEGNEKAAKIYKRMAQIKRDAGAANKAGKEFSWDEYHQLAAQLNGGGKGKDHKKHDKADKKSDKSDHGDGFLKAAAEYEEKGKWAIKKGDAEKAQIYFEMADIKRQASAANKAGKDFSWDRYHELQKKLNGGHDKKHKEVHDKPKDVHKDDHLE